MTRRTPMPYREALQWIIENDDTEWLALNQTASVTASLVADIYKRTDDEVRTDLRRIQCLP